MKTAPLGHATSLLIARQFYMRLDLAEINCFAVGVKGG